MQPINTRTTARLSDWSAGNRTHHITAAAEIGEVDRMIAELRVKKEAITALRRAAADLMSIGYTMRQVRDFIAGVTPNQE